MNSPLPHVPPESPAAGQSQRLPGSSRDAALHDQLYRYAEDLEQIIERHAALESRHATLREMCSHLTESRTVLDELVRCSRDVHLVTDAGGTILQCNPAAAAIAPPPRLTGYNLGDWVLPEYRPNYLALRQQARDGQTGGPDEWELRLRRADAEQPPAIFSAQTLAVRREDGAQHLHWILRDVTHLRETEFESQISSMVFKNASEGVMITDIEGEILAVNPAFSRITGYQPAEVVGRNPRFLRSGIQDEAFYAEFWRALREQGAWQGEIYNRKKNGEVFPEWLTVSAARDLRGNTLSYIAVFSDLSHLLQTEKRLSYLAHHDTLTDLPNRLLFQDRLAQTLSQARRSGVPFTLLFIDLDRFKPINDELGHEIGDRVLQETARRLAAAVREVDTVARLGGDEFVILAPGLTGDEDIGRVCGKLLDALALPIRTGQHELFIGGSLGCAEYPRHGDTEVTLLKHADVAMYRAKAGGGNCYVIFEHGGGQEDHEETLHLETELRRALERDELYLAYQPQVAAEGGALLGVEALLRWDHPRLGSVPPAKLIPVAEQIGLIVPLGDWVIRTACRQLAVWDRQGMPPLSMAVNVSPRQLRDPGFVDQVKAALAESGIAPPRLELEITETELMFNHDLDRCKLEPLRQLGVKIAIDDFGTVYASLALLMRMPVDRLKIDRGFVGRLEHAGDERAGQVSAAIVAMGRAIGLDLVAEGVESDGQQAAMTRQGCQVIQGYYTGRPMTPAALERWAVENPATIVPRGIA